MAVYGRDFYGLSKYGSEAQIDFAVEPVLADPTDYDTIRVSWTSPSGNWTRLRLVRGRFGYAANENDGETVLEATGPVSTYLDVDIEPGDWYYYTIFIEVDGEWVRAAGTSAVAVKDHRHKDLLTDLVPRYFRYTRRRNSAVTDTYYFQPEGAEVYNPEDYDRVNQHLMSFLTVLGWGLDLLKTYHETLLHANNPYEVHSENLDRLARQVGTHYEYSVPQRYMRSKVANTALLARSRGTVEGLRDEIALSTGYDVDITLGPNKMLDIDQSTFAHPIYPEYHPGTNYAEGQRVKYGTRIYQANPGGAYGWAQRPNDVSPYNNTYWNVVSAAEVTTLTDPDTGGIASWRTYLNDQSAAATTRLAVGVTNSVGTESEASNALKVRNPAATAKDIIVVAAANSITSLDPTPARLPAIRHGIPIKKSVEMALSFYAHGPDFFGTTGAGATAVRGRVFCFDDRGALLNTLIDPAPRGMVYDHFDTVSEPFDNRIPPHTILGATWDVTSGDFDMWEEEGVVYPSGVDNVAVIQIPADRTQYAVAATFNHGEVPGKTQGIVLRYVDNNNFIRVTRTVVERRATGTYTTLATLSQTVSDGDRVTVNIDDGSGAVTVLRNDASVASINIGAATGPHRVGLMVM